jgi:hypothetical protein
MYGAAADGGGGAGDRERVSGEGGLGLEGAGARDDVRVKFRFFDIFRKKPVSLHHLRHEKNCLNCGATVEERYCTRCGQENVEPKESVGHLVGHFFADITHFDSKIFTTLKDLVLRPGFLTREYVEGRRVAYLNPIRMYVFISAIFFVALFAEGRGSADHPEGETRAVNAFRQQLADSLRGVGTGGLHGPGAGMDSMRRVFNAELAARLDSTSKGNGMSETLSLKWSSSGKVLIDIEENKYKKVREYDSVQRSLPDSSRDKGIMAWILRNNVRQKEKNGGRSKLHLEVNVQHDIPKIMFVLLPLFALYVGCFYPRKKYYYVNHAIFSVHFHSFVFLFFLFLMLLNAVIPGDWTGLILAAISPLPIFIYLVAALRGMYGQSVGKSLLKAVAISLLYAITLSVASVALMIFALTQI